MIIELWRDPLNYRGVSQAFPDRLANASVIPLLNCGCKVKGGVLFSILAAGLDNGGLRTIFNRGEISCCIVSVKIFKQKLNHVPERTSVCFLALKLRAQGE